jgi:hypothetical protein
MYSDIFTGDVQDKRFFGIYRGIVTDNDDPKNENRIRMQIPQILGTAVTGWAYPIFQTATEVNEPVWVLFEGGDPNFPLWMGTTLNGGAV